MRHRRLHRSAGGGPHPDRGAQAARVPGLRLGRDRPRRRRRRPVRGEAGRQAGQPPDGHRRSDAARRDRPRPHALGDAWPAERSQCPSAPRLHGRDHGHPQRDHRELPRPARRARGTRPSPDLGDRHRSHRPPGRGGLPGRPGRRRPACAPAARGRLRDRGDAYRRGRPAGRRPQGRAAGGRPRRRRELPGLRCRGDPGPHRPDRVPRGRRRRGPPAVGRHHHRRPRRRARTAR